MPTITHRRTDEATADRFRFGRTDPTFKDDNETPVSDGGTDDLRSSGILPAPAGAVTHMRSWENPIQGATDQTQDPTPAIDPVIRIRRPGAGQRDFEILQQWEGVVTKLEDDTFWADLLDLSDRANPLEVAEIMLSEIPLADRPLLNPGSVFYWSIGYETSEGGQIRRVSEIRLRRMPEWTQRAIDNMRERAKDLFERLTNDGENKCATK